MDDLRAKIVNTLQQRSEHWTDDTLAQFLEEARQASSIVLDHTFEHGELPRVIADVPLEEMLKPYVPCVQVTFSNIIPLPSADSLPGGLPQHDEIILSISTYLDLCHASIVVIRQKDADLAAMTAGLMSVGLFMGTTPVRKDFLYRLRSLHTHIAAITIWQQWKNRVDALCALSYTMLIDRRATREDVFKIAVHNLWMNPPKSENSWRVRVDNYAKDRGLSPIGQPLRKPRKKSAKIS